MKKLKKYCLECILTLASAVLLCILAKTSYEIYTSPCHVTVNCQGNQITGDIIENIEKQQENGYLGLINIAGWRYADNQKVASMDTKKESSANVIGVFGDMSLVFGKRLLTGSFGSQTKDNFCVITKDLSWELFGSADVTGKIVEMSGMLWTVDGVLDKKGNYILIPEKKAELDYLELIFDSRRDVKQKIEELYPGLNSERKV